MTSINLVFISLFILTTAIVVSLVAKPNRWKAVLVTCLLFYYLLIGEKIMVVIIVALFTYSFSHLVYLRKSKLWMPVVILLIPLLVFKFTSVGNHFENYRLQDWDTFNWANWSSLFQVVGLSYFTFNSISYLIDIKRNYITPEKNFFFLLLYLVYFPTAFSGPLHRANYLFQELRNIEITNDSITNGLRLILWVLFKNLVIAQRLFTLMTLFQNSETGGIYYLLIGLLFFLYLYCNFSSFIDFFQGVSKIFNINLKPNFRNRVYLSSSRQEFWKGWHITLNEWFRDYFFFVLSKYDKRRNYTDIFLFITFLLIALWHELSVVLLIWGLLNGLWIVIEKKFDFKKWKYPKFRKVAGVLYHLSISSVLALIFISPKLNFLYDKIIVHSPKLPSDFFENYLVRTVIVISLLGIMDYHYSKAKNKGFDEYVGMKPKFVRWFIYVKLVMIILIFGTSAGVENYYIQF